MESNEARRHYTRQHLLRTMAHLRHANRELLKAEDDSQYCRIFSSHTRAIWSNINALRAGIEETQNYIAQEVVRVTESMETPTAVPPTMRGHHLENWKLTPRQKQLERQGTDFGSILPKYEKPPPPLPSPPTILPFNLKTVKKKKINKKKLGIIPI